MHIETPPLEIRPWAAGDLWLLERLMGDAQMTRYLGGPDSPKKLRQRHERYLGYRESETAFVFAILVGPEKIPAGWTGYWELEWQGVRVWETGWTVLPEFQGLGIATRGTLAALELARGHGRHRFVHAFPSVENAPSNAVCHKIGFTLQAAVDFEHPPGSWMRCYDWRMELKSDASKG